MLKPIRLALLLACVAWAASPAAAATEELREKLRLLAQKVLAEAKGRPISVGTFSGTGLPEVNSGEGIERQLAATLEAISKGCVQKAGEGAKVEVKGDYAFAKTTPTAATRVVRIKARVVDLETTDELTTVPFEIAVDGTTGIGEILQLSGSVPEQGRKEERNQKLEEIRRTPTTVCDGSKIKSHADSRYTVEILAKNVHDSGPAQPRTARIENGLAFVDLKPDDVYEVRVTNGDQRHLAFSLSVDGLDMYQFSQDRDPKTNRPLYSHNVLPPGKEGTVVGWHNRLRGDQNYFRFQVKNYGEGLASQSGIPRGKTGVIHLSFRVCRLLAAGSRSAPGLETGKGPPVDIRQEAVRTEMDPAHEFLAIRYSR